MVQSWKDCVGATPPGVRIPSSPVLSQSTGDQWNKINQKYTLTVQVRQAENPNIYKHTADLGGFCIWRCTCTNYRLSALFVLLLALILHHPEFISGSH